MSAEINECLSKVNIAELPTSVQVLIVAFINKLESLEQGNHELRIENQGLKDEINRLKGEQGKPVIAGKKKEEAKDCSSESERNAMTQSAEKPTRKSKAKNHKIQITRAQKCKVDPAILPADAVFKGYCSSICQDLKIVQDNVDFQKEQWYSAAQQRSYLAEVPAGYEGGFGPNIKAMVMNLHHQSKMTQPAIVDFLRTNGVEISAGTIARMLTEGITVFHQEKQDIFDAMLASSVPIQTDDTHGTEKGQTVNVHVVCNPLACVFFTRPNKSRETVLRILTNDKLVFSFQEPAYALMKELNVPEKVIRELKKEVNEGNLDENEANQLIDKVLCKVYDSDQELIGQKVFEAAAIVGYRKSENAVSCMMADDAPQYKHIVDNLAVCLVHDIRHYKKLTPQLEINRKKLSHFLSEYFLYYKALLDYRSSPDPIVAKQLSSRFDLIFSTKTGYDELDKRIAMTLTKKKSLTMVLHFPDFPLHNNASELAARAQARRRDISLHTMSKTGTAAKDTFMSITETAKKLGVNTFDYLHDRICKKNLLPSLAHIIQERSADFALRQVEVPLP